jgi:hypothetical protein
VNERRFFNNTQPQTLQIAVILLYIDAAFSLLFGGLGTVIGILLIATMAAGAYGIANEQRWGYALGLVGAGLNLLYPFLLGVSFGEYLSYDPLGLMFAVALVALLLHPMSRDYQRIWFK